MATKSEGPVRIACFGDSLTQGYGMNSDEAMPAILEQMLRENGIRATCLNFGVSGDTTGDGLARIKEVIESRPDTAIVEFGANDSFVGEPIEIIKGNLERILEILIENSIPVLLVGITALMDFGSEYKAEFDRIFQDQAEKYDLPLFPDILSCYFGDSSMMLMDGMHPNEQGAKAIAGCLLPLVKDLVGKATD